MNIIVNKIVIEALSKELSDFFKIYFESNSELYNSKG